MASIIKPKRGSVAPTTANLVDGEIAINTADKKIYTNIGGTVHELSPSTATTPAGSNTQVQFNNDGVFGASSNFVFNSSLNSVTIKSTLNINKVTGVGGLFITAGDTTTTAQAIGNLEFITNQSPGKTIAIKTNNGTNLLTLTLDPTNNKLELLNENAALTTTFIVDGNIEAGIQIDAPYFKGSLLGATQQECRNETGSLISKGMPIYIVGYSGNRVLIAPAEASNSAKMPAVGLLETDIADASNGHYTILGVAKNINTSSYAVNETLYVASAGGLTNVRPTGATTLIQNIGKVVNVGNNGEILVMGPGRSNDVPNTLVARTGLYTNEANGIRLYDLDSSNYLRLKPADTMSGDVTLTLPSTVGNSNDVLSTDNTGQLSWIDRRFYIPALASTGYNERTAATETLYAVPIGTQTFTGGVVATNTAYFNLFYVPTTTAVNLMVYSFNTTTTGNFIAGIYKADGVNGLPNTKIYSSVSTAVSSGFAFNTITATGGVATLTPGLYYTACIFNSTPTMAAVSGRSINPWGVFSPGSGDFTKGYSSAIGSYSLPSTITTSFVWKSNSSNTAICFITKAP
jgi:hypothetical protein